jgi:hypothetical protein
VNHSIEEKNKVLVIEVFEAAFNRRDPVAFDRYWSPSYLQRSAHIPPGRDGLARCGDEAYAGTEAAEMFRESGLGSQAFPTSAECRSRSLATDPQREPCCPRRN